MSKALDWSRASNRTRAARHGIDDITDMTLPGGLAPPRQRPSKADQRAALAEALGKATRQISCVCGHSASVVVPTARAGRRLKCSRCGEITR